RWSLSMAGVASAAIWLVAVGHVDLLTQTALKGGPVSAANPDPVPGETVRVGGAIKEPKKVKNVAPVYPEAAKQAGVQGIVILECTIGPQGEVTDVKVL